MRHERKMGSQACGHTDERPIDVTLAAGAGDSEGRKPSCCRHACEQAEYDCSEPICAGHSAYLVPALAGIAELVRITTILHRVPAEPFGVVLIAPWLKQR